MRDVHANIVTIIAYRRTQNFSHLALLRLLVHQKCARSHGMRNEMTASEQRKGKRDL